MHDPSIRSFALLVFAAAVAGLAGCGPQCSNGFSPATPSTFSGADVVSIFGEASTENPSVCAINEGGEVGCVGGFGDTPFAAAAAPDPTGCSLDGQQNLVCDEDTVSANVASFQSAAQGLAVCFTRTDGSSACAWANQLWADSEQEATLSGTACVLLGNQVRCFASPPSMNSITSLSVGWTLTETQADGGQPVPGLSEVSQLSFSSISNVGCAIDPSGAVLCFGGQPDLGLGGATPGSATAVVDSDSHDPLTDAVQLSVASDHACAVESNGSVRCWGAEMANGSDSQTAVQVSGIGDATSVVAGDSNNPSFGGVNCALKHGGTVVCWGSDLATSCPDQATFFPNPGD